MCTGVPYTRLELGLQWDHYACDHTRELLAYVLRTSLNATHTVGMHPAPRLNMHLRPVCPVGGMRVAPGLGKGQGEEAQERPAEEGRAGA